MGTRRFSGLVLGVCLGCAAWEAPEPASLPASAAEARRVAQIFAHHHLQPRTLDAARARVLLNHVLAALVGEGACARAPQRLEREVPHLRRALRDGDFSVASRLAEACGVAAPSPARARALVLDALAKAHDPHSAYLDAAALAALRQQIHRPSGSQARVRGRMLEHAGTRIGLLRVPAFYLHTDRSTASDARYLVETLASEGADVIVVDLRGNGGGVESEVGALVGVFVGEGAIGQVVDREGEVRVLRSRGERVWQGPLVVAIDGMTASVAEVSAAALQDLGRALVVGRQSHGKGTGQTLVLLSSPTGGKEGAVRVTDRSYHRLDGTSLQRQGVTPDVVLPSVLEPPVTERQRPGALEVSAVAPLRAPVPMPHPEAKQAHFGAALAVLREQRR